MKVEVKLLNDKGSPVPAAALKSQKRYLGALGMAEARSSVFGRSVMVAHLRSASDEDLLPMLHDAVVLRLEGDRIRIRGVEILNGVHYGQTWDMKVVKC
jgi:hypothetical protein